MIGGQQSFPIDPRRDLPDIRLSARHSMLAGDRFRRTLLNTGQMPSTEFIAFWLDQGRVRAGMNVNTLDVTDTIRQLVLSNRGVSVAALTDSATPLLN